MFRLNYCVKEAEQALARLPNSEDVAAAAARLSTDLIVRHCTASQESDSSALLTAVQADLVALHGLIAATYFAPPPRASTRGRQSQRQNA